MYLNLLHHVNKLSDWLRVVATLITRVGQCLVASVCVNMQLAKRKQLIMIGSRKVTKTSLR